MELSTIFNNVEFYAPTHTYKHKLSGEVFTSVTQLIARYKNPFDPTGAIAKAIAKRDDSTVEEVQAKWKAKSKEALTLGNRIHSLFENHIKGDTQTDMWIKPFEYALEKIGCSMELEGIRFYPEFLVYDEDNKVAGTVDLLIHLPNNEYIIVDYKTNAVFKHPDDEADYVKPMKSPFMELKDCNYNHYTLQLNAYRNMLVKKGVNVTAMYIFHINRDIKDVDIHQINYTSLGNVLLTGNLCFGTELAAVPVPQIPESEPKPTVSILNTLVDVAVTVGEINRYEATLIKKYIKFLKQDKVKA